MDSQPLDFEKPILELQRRLQELKSHSDQHEIANSTFVARALRTAVRIAAQPCLEGAASLFPRIIYSVQHTPNRDRIRSQVLARLIAEHEEAIWPWRPAQAHLHDRERRQRGVQGNRGFGDQPSRRKPILA